MTQELVRELYDETANEPVIEARTDVGRSALKKYWMRAKPYVKEAAENLGIKPYFRKLRIGYEKLQTQMRNGRIVGKVAGYFKPPKTVRIDTALPPELGDDERYELKRSGLLQEPTDVITHEGIHTQQYESGALQRYFEKFGIFGIAIAEGVATYLTEKVTGRKQPIYPLEKKLVEHLISKYGEKPIIQGTVKLRPAYAR
ncbi:MAG: hypothetical protein V1802_03180 [Candidatus Aenigmatarchaeota archaeon]